jgi:ammonium transporter, Amt family
VTALLILLIPFAFAGLALMNAGLVRSRNAAHSLMATLTVAAAAVLAYVVCGFAWQGWQGGPAYALSLGSQSWNWIGAERLFLRGVDFDAAGLQGLAAGFGMLSAALAALITLGAGAERWRLGPAAISSAVLAGFTYPLFAHWVWGGGWLAQLGFLDAGGAGVLQATGGLTALSVAWLLGPRRGKYAGQDRMPAAIPGHNAVFVLFGCLLALVGWFGLNSAAALLFYGASVGRITLVAVNTTLAAGSALLGAALITRTRFGKPDASLSANGWTAGLVASSAAAAFLAPAEAIIVGLVAGALVPLSIEMLELHLEIDDPGGAISVHGVAGLWGVLAAGFLGRVPGAEGQWLAQLVGLATLLGCMLPLTYGLNWILNRLAPFRVSLDGERQGMDLHELGANAYPELVTHLEDFTQR